MTYHFDADQCDADMAELRAEAAAMKRYQRRLGAHPNCADPDHLGCQFCEDTEEIITEDDNNE